MRALVLLLLLSAAPVAAQPEDPAPEPSGEPFAWGDFTWLNGNDRRKTALLDSKYFTGRFLLDASYTVSDNHPVDNTVVGSTAVARENEFQVTNAVFGGDFHHENVRATFMLQVGTRATVIPRTDLSVLRGQQDLANAYRYVSEANVGYQFPLMHGMNIDAGIFPSFIGLFSYYNAENWSYQPSFSSESTPYYLNGVRIQAFPTDRLKVELWLINGWQSYAKFNNRPGLGLQILYRPQEWLSLTSNEYYGADTQNRPDRKRFHSNHNVQVRYRTAPSSWISQAALSVSADVGVENGGGVSGFSGDAEGPAQYFVGAGAYHRLWFVNGTCGWTVGGGFMRNPGRYLVLYPTGDANPIPAVNTGTIGTNPFSANPGDPFFGWETSTTFDWMPNDLITWRVEVVYREADIPYFAGPGGVTAPDGINTTPPPAGWRPDLVKSETRFIGALLVRF